MVPIPQNLWQNTLDPMVEKKSNALPRKLVPYVYKK